MLHILVEDNILPEFAVVRPCRFDLAHIGSLEGGVAHPEGLERAALLDRMLDAGAALVGRSNTEELHLGYVEIMHALACRLIYIGVSCISCKLQQDYQKQECRVHADCSGRLCKGAALQLPYAS